MNKKRVWSGLAVAFAAALAGCQSTSGGSYPSSNSESKSSTIVAEPADLDCMLRDNNDTAIPGIWRSGETIGFYGYAPPIRITCERAGYHSYSTVVYPRMSGEVGALSLLVGGVGMLAANSAAGVGLNYPTTIPIRLEPKQFPSVAERDRWYERRIDEVSTERRRGLQAELSGCNQDQCEEVEAKFEASLRAEIRAMHARRLSAEILPE